MKKPGRKLRLFLLQIFFSVVCLFCEIAGKGEESVGGKAAFCGGAKLFIKIGRKYDEDSGTIFGAV